MLFIFPYCAFHYQKIYILQSLSWLLFGFYSLPRLHRLTKFVQV